MKTYHLIIKGLVQGVYYRKFCYNNAQSLHISGWVQNIANGDVESFVSGEEENLKKFIELCYQGPQNAQIDEIIIKEHKFKTFSQFDIKY